jgi:hypothetical protein
MMLDPQDALALLELRLAGVDAELADVRQVIGDSADLPRISLVEEEYRQAVLSAERAWLTALIADLRDGRITWSKESIRQAAAEFHQKHANDDSNDKQGQEPA